MARKAVAEELSRDRILAGARELFGTCGYRALTMRSIAKSLGYSHGALYYHFKEKAELLYELIIKDLNDFYYRQRKYITEASYINIPLLKKMMMEFIRFGLELPRHYEMMFMMDDDELQAYSQKEQTRSYELFYSVIHQLDGSKSHKESTVNLTWSILMNLHGFISYNIYYGNKLANVQKIAEDHVRFLCEMVESACMDSNLPLRGHETA